MNVLCDFVISLHIEDLRYIMLQQHRGHNISLDWYNGLCPYTKMIGRNSITKRLSVILVVRRTQSLKCSYVQSLACMRRSCLASTPNFGISLYLH
jgi:hypothetical protein